MNQPKIQQFFSVLVADNVIGIKDTSTDVEPGIDNIVVGKDGRKVTWMDSWWAWPLIILVIAVIVFAVYSMYKRKQSETPEERGESDGKTKKVCEACNRAQTGGGHAEHLEYLDNDWSLNSNRRYNIPL